MRIHQLPKILANQIAAGEVIERPASVLKECVENSLDAGATHIEIEIENAGMGLIRIIDNGHGIHKEDLKLALSRHATSKIQKVDDLFCISSLGFRGEALASMASVAKLRLLSRAKNSEEAWEIRSDGDDIEEPLSCVREVGTTLELRDLFYNVPVRRKFLRSEKTELYHIIELFKKFVLSHFSVGFCLKSNQRRLYTFAKAESEMQKLARIKKICGVNFVEQAVSIDTPYESMRLWGWIGCSEAAKRQAETQYFFINNRMVRDKLIIHAIKNAYQIVEKDLLGLHPSFLLHFELPANRIDVNVHPTKHEVRFVEASLVHDFIEKCVKEALESSIPGSNTLSVLPEQTAIQARYVMPMVHRQPKENYSPSLPYAIPKKNDLPMSTSVNINRELHAIHEGGSRWFVMEREEKLYLFDLFGIKKKIFFHFMSTSVCQSQRKSLLFPIIYDLMPQPHLMSLLSELGFLCIQSEDRLKITHIPYFIPQESVHTLLKVISEQAVLNLSLIKNLVLEYIDDESLYAIPKNWLQSFLNQWINQTSDGPWLTLNTNELEQQIKERATSVDCPED